MSDKLVIGIVGPKHAGKSTVSRLINELSGTTVGHPVIRFSDVMFRTLKDWGIEPTRPNLQKLAISMERDFGPGSVSRATFNRVNHIQEKPIVTEGCWIITEGIRWPSDHQTLRRYQRNVLLYVTAEAYKRYPRRLTQGEKVGEADMSFEEYLRNEREVETERHIENIGRQADFVICNNGSLEDLKANVQKFLDFLIEKKK